MRILVASAAMLFLPLTAFAQAPAAATSASAATAPAFAPASADVENAAAKAPKGEPRGAQPSAHLAAAQRLYQKLDLDAALAELQLAEGARTSEDEIVQILIYRGLIYSETGKTADASDQFKRALAMRPWVEVPPETSPRIAKMFTDARKSVWGMASVKPPKRRPVAAAPAVTLPVQAPAPVSVPTPAPNAVPAAVQPDQQPKAEPAVAK